MQCFSVSAQHGLSVHNILNSNAILYTWQYFKSVLHNSSEISYHWPMLLLPYYSCSCLIFIHIPHFPRIIHFFIVSYFACPSCHLSLYHSFIEWYIDTMLTWYRTLRWRFTCLEVYNVSVSGKNQLKVRASVTVSLHFSSWNEFPLIICCY
jgi:hypothetical protein